ncbi:hypothetical protein HRG_012452 [Hirsutella rhossiliensis]
MPRAASPSAASRHRLLLPPLLAGLDFCRLAAPTSSAASRPDFFSPFLARLALPRTLCRLYWLASPSAALRLCLLLPSRGSELAALRPFLPPSGHDFLWTAAHQSTTPPPPACYEEQARGLRRLS